MTIHPGGSASATLHTTNGPIGGSCSSTSSYPRVYPPASRQSVLVPYALRDCSHVFTVSPVRSGSNS